MRNAAFALLTFFAAVVVSLTLTTTAVRAQQRDLSPLAGTWTLVAADVQRADGSIQRDFGTAPAGRLTIDGAGRYALMIFDTGRPRFASGDKATGTAEEFRASMLAQSVHFGTVNVDQAAGTLIFDIEQSSFTNWNGTRQTRQYELQGDQLSYRVPPRANGDVPISIWRRVAP